jgi:hypothetical protein
MHLQDALFQYNTCACGLAVPSSCIFRTSNDNLHSQMQLPPVLTVIPAGFNLICKERTLVMEIKTARCFVYCKSEEDARSETGREDMLLSNHICRQSDCLAARAADKDPELGSGKNLSSKILLLCPHLCQSQIFKMSR